MNDRIVKLFAFIAVSFAVLVGFTSNWTVFDAQNLKNERVNKRPLFNAQKIERGRILAADGTVIARSVRKGSGPSLRYVRDYPEGGTYGHPIGYSFVEFGNSEFEAFHNSELIGDDNEFASIFDQIRGKDPIGNDIRTSIDPEAQQAAFDALGGQAGAVVAIEPDTGAVKALVSRAALRPELDSLRSWRAEPGPVVAAAQPGHPGPVSARLHLQAGHRCGGPRLRSDQPR